MPELEEAKKELQGLVKEEKAQSQKRKDETLSPEQRQAAEAEAKKQKEQQEAEKAKVQEQAKKDKELMSKDEENLSDDEKKRRAEIVKQEESKLSDVQKLERSNEKMQKRIDELVKKVGMTENQGKEQQESLKKEIEAIRKEKASLEKRLNPPKDEDIIRQEVNGEMSKRQKQYLEEDNDKDRHLRREMSDEEWNEWFLEDAGAAVDWRGKRSVRREREQQELLGERQNQHEIKSFIEKVNESNEKVETKHPELKIGERKQKLAAEGKNEEEIIKMINEENPKVRMMREIVTQDRDKYFRQIVLEDGKKGWVARYPDTPERLMKEMEKRLAPKSGKMKELEEKVEKLETALAAKESRENLDEGVNSTTRRHTSTSKQPTEEEQSLINMMKSDGANQGMIDRAVEKFRERKGNA